MQHQEIIFTNNVSKYIDELISEISPSGVFILADKNTETKVLSRLNISHLTKTENIIVIEAGDSHKNLDSLNYIWSKLVENGATRKSLLLNIGGGVITDIGGFAGATFKRGIKFINIPTTLLSAVDAAVGGKTGINFNGYKNEIGAFCEADAVIISTMFFDTLPNSELISGYAEMLKHGLISSTEVYNKLITFDITDENIDKEYLLSLLQESVMVKKHIVEQDPKEKGIRRALNLGHTIGHAFESLALHRQSPIPHGYAVAWGMVVELILSHLQLKFPSNELTTFGNYVYNTFGKFDINCDDYETLIAFMRHDKKNTSADSINFTLLENVGKIKIDCTASEDEIKTALDIFRDMMHI